MDNLEMLRNFKDITELGVSMALRDIGDYKVPVVVADRNLVLYYLNFKNIKLELDDEIDELKTRSDFYEIKKTKDIKDKLRLHREYKARTSRLEKSMYYECEVTGEMVLLSSIRILDGKLVSSKYFRRLEREQIKKQQELANKRERILKQSRNRRNYVSKTTLESQFERGVVTEQDIIEAKAQKLTLEEIREMQSDFEYFTKISSTEDQARKLAYHAHLERRIRKNQVLKESKSDEALINSLT